MNNDLFDKIYSLSMKYKESLANQIKKRISDMENDDRSHYLVYRVLGVLDNEGKLIDEYQNKGRFLYKYAGSFLEESTMICFENNYSVKRKFKIPNTLSSRPKTFEIDCLVDNEAFEIKWKDATTDGDHILKEHTRLKNIQHAGYKPIRIMFFYPQRQQAMKIQSTLKTLYEGVGGEYYYSSGAWELIKNRTNIDLYNILERISNINTNS